MPGAPGIFEFRVRHDAATILRERGLLVPEHLKETSADVLLRVFCHAPRQEGGPAAGWL